MYIQSTRIVTPQGCVSGILHLEQGKIIELLDIHSPVAVDLDVQDNRILPGIIDTHNHGTLGYGAMGFEGDIEKELRGYLKGLASQLSLIHICKPAADPNELTLELNLKSRIP